MKNRISIGISSIVLIFLILCLAVFSLLSLSDAKRALSFSQRHTDAVRVYYAADAQGQTFIRDYRKALADDMRDSDSKGKGVSALIPADTALKAAQAAAMPLPEGYVVSVTEDNALRCDVPLENGQTLRMELDLSGMEVLSYYIFNSTDYVIDTRLPVFGADMAQ